MEKINYKGTFENVYHEKLDNGLDIYMYPLNTKGYYMALNVKFGSTCTEYKINNKTYNVPNGTAHYLEHKCFDEKGGSAYDYFDNLGVYANAFTTYDYTSFEVSGDVDFSNSLNHLLEFVYNEGFTEGSINKERNIIKEEIRMYKENPSSRLNYELEYNLNKFDKHKYMVCGDIDDIKNINYEILDRTYKHFYTPSNMFLVVTGNFKPLEVIGVLKEFFKNKEYKTYEYTIVNKKEPLDVCKRYSKLNISIKTPKIKIGVKLDNKQFKSFDDNTLGIYLDSILNIKFGTSSDLLEYLENQNICTNILYNSEIRDDYILITLETNSKYIKEIEELLTNNLNDITINESDLNRIKNVNISNYIRNLSDINVMAELIEGDILSNNKIIDNMFELYNNMNIEDINEIASKINTKNVSTCVIEPKTM